VSAFIHPTAEVPDGAAVGEGSKVWHQAQLLPGATVGRDCTIGKGAFLSGTAVLGDLVKVGNAANVMGARVEDAAFIGPQAYLMEDPRPRATNPDGGRRGPGDWRSSPVTVRHGATVGGGALVLPGVTVGEWAMVAAGAVVHRDVPAHGLVAGNPARQVGWVCSCGDTLDEALVCPACARTHELEGDRLREVDAA
jgi:UDP-2-acetamido-3-amino-2,3-dideoxy-glucuronate N-acetyltransferase